MKLRGSQSLWRPKVQATIAEDHLGAVWGLRRPEETNVDQTVNRLLGRGIAAEKRDREKDLVGAPGIED